MDTIKNRMITEAVLVDLRDEILSTKSEINIRLQRIEDDRYSRSEVLVELADLIERLELLTKTRAEYDRPKPFWKRMVLRIF